MSAPLKADGPAMRGRCFAGPPTGESPSVSRSTPCVGGAFPAPQKNRAGQSPDCRPSAPPPCACTGPCSNSGHGRLRRQPRWVLLGYLQKSCQLRLIRRQRAGADVRAPNGAKIATPAPPFQVDRLKTGTPPRIDGRSLDYSVMDEQPGDSPRPVMSFLGSVDEHPQQVSCWITHTTEQTHQIIRDALHRSPLYSGQIEGIGPRYCPSIEDKVVRFAEKASHQIFVEPEGLGIIEIYPNGISTSLPFDLQLEMVRSSVVRKRTHHPPRLRDRVRLLRSARAEGLAGDQAGQRPVLRRPDQRHHRL